MVTEEIGWETLFVENRGLLGIFFFLLLAETLGMGVGRGGEKLVASCGCLGL